MSRNRKLDMAKCFAVILMIFAHCITNGSGAEYKANGTCFNNIAYTYIYTFHMPLFMIISGYLFGKGIKKKSFKTILCSRFNSLLIPIVVWQALYSTVNITRNTFRNGFDFMYILKKYIVDFAHIYRNMWFLWAIIACTLMIAVLHFLFKDNIIVAIISVLSTWFIPFECVQLWLAFYPCFLAAYLFAINEPKYGRFKTLFGQWYTIVILIVIHILLFQLWNPHFYPYIGKPTCLNIIYVLDNGNYLYNIYVSILRIGIGLAGAMVWLLVFYKIEGYMNSILINKIVLNISKSSMGFYVLSTYFLNYYLKSMTWLQPNVFLWISFTITIMLICYIFFEIVNRIPILKRLLLGGR